MFIARIQEPFQIPSGMQLRAFPARPQTCWASGRSSRTSTHSSRNLGNSAALEAVSTWWNWSGDRPASKQIRKDEVVVQRQSIQTITRETVTLYKVSETCVQSLAFLGLPAHSSPTSLLKNSRGKSTGWTTKKTFSFRLWGKSECQGLCDLLIKQ